MAKNTIGGDIPPLASARLRLRQVTGIELLVPWVIAAIVVAFLYLGRSVLVPITLAVLLSFLLTPIVAGLRRLRFGRAPSVVLAVVLALGAIATTSAVIISQAGRLSKDAPAYAEGIATKAALLREGVHQRFGFLLRESGQAGQGPTAAQFAQKAEGRRIARNTSTKAVPVEIRETPPTAIEEIEAIVLPALAPVETALIVLVVAIFILFQKEDLRDRLIRVMGTADIHRTTTALDDGGKRLSRYFLSQFVVNCGFGAVIWGGLFLIGVPSPGLWGILAGLLRFIPYVGVLVAAVGPFALAAAVDPQWTMVIYVALLFVVIEPVVGYLIEPLLYGHSTGLAPVSVVVAALFWTLIWGPVGLVLAMPLTLMLVVLGRHIPAFEVFDVLLGDRPALSAAETFYQRALAGHPEQVIEQAEDILETQTLSEYYEYVVLAALRLAAADIDRGAVQRLAVETVCEVAMEAIGALALHPLGVPVKANDVGEGQHIVCVSGRGLLDVAVAAMIAHLARIDGYTVSEHVRQDWGGGVSSQFDPGDAKIICLLGLFDIRAQRRLEPIVNRLRETFPRQQTLTGVCRTDIPSEQASSEQVHGTLASMSEAINGITRREHVRATGRTDRFSES
jgi:predicted PurR-regulated permease PerM